MVQVFVAAVQVPLEHELEQLPKLPLGHEPVAVVPEVVADIEHVPTEADAQLAGGATVQVADAPAGLRTPFVQVTVAAVQVDPYGTLALV